MSKLSPTDVVVSITSSTRSDLTYSVVNILSKKNRPVLMSTVEFRTHRDTDGYIRNNPRASVVGPIQPGAMVVIASASNDLVDIRTGLIVAVHDDSVSVMWNAWHKVNVFFA